MAAKTIGGRVPVPRWLGVAYGKVPLPVSVTHDRRLVWVNREFEVFYRCRLEAVRGKPMKDVVVTQDQLVSQSKDIEKLTKALQDRGVGIRHFKNLSRGVEVGVMVLAFSIQHLGRELRVGIAIPDDLNDLLGLLARYLVTPDFDENRFLGMLTERQYDLLQDLATPGASAKAAGGSRTRNGAGDAVPPIRTKLTKQGWLVQPSEFKLRELSLLAMALRPQFEARRRSPKGRSKTSTA